MIRTVIIVLFSLYKRLVFLQYNVDMHGRISEELDQEYYVLTNQHESSKKRLFCGTAKVNYRSGQKYTMQQTYNS